MTLCFAFGRLSSFFNWMWVVNIRTLTMKYLKCVVLIMRFHFLTVVPPTGTKKAQLGQFLYFHDLVN